MPAQQAETLSSGGIPGLILPGQLEHKKPLIIPGHPDLEIESASRLGLLEPILKTDSMVLLSGRANPELAQKVANRLGFMLEKPISLFEDGETMTEVEHNLRERRVYVIQPTVREIDDQGNTIGSVNDALFELLQMIHTAGNSSAKPVTAIIPYYGYARQDRKVKSRTPISAALVAKLIETAGANRIVTIDLHAEQTMGSVDCPWDNLYGRAVLLDEIKRMGTDNLVVAAPDAGGGKRAEIFSQLLGGDGDIALVYKTRPKPGESRVLKVAGDVEGKRVVIVDDIIGGAGTIANAAKSMVEDCGAQCVIVAATHGRFSGDAIERINDSVIEKVFVTDTIAHEPDTLNCSKIKVITIAPLIAEIIRRIETGESLAALIPEVKSGKKS